MLTLLKKSKRYKTYYMKFLLKPDKNLPVTNKPVNLRVHRVEYDDETIANDPAFGKEPLVELDILKDMEYVLNMRVDNVEKNIKRLEFGIVEEGYKWHYKLWVDVN